MKWLCELLLDPGFLGALVGSLLTGLTAIGILWYETYSRKKEQVFRSYGTMKILAAKLILFYEIEKITNEKIKMSQLAKEDDLRKLLQEPKKMNKDILDFLENEKDYIPYEFITRYFTLINQFKYISHAFDRAIDNPNENNFNLLVKHLKGANDIIRRFNDNNAKYLKEVEKKI